MRWSKTVTVVGAHAEGEVGRVVTGGVIDVPGKTMLDKMVYLNREDDSIRRFTLFEPRGSAQMSVNLLLPPTRPEADAGFIVMQPDAAHSMSGSNAMCVATVLLETGMLAMREPETIVVLDTPAGLVTAVASCRDGKVEKVALDLYPSFVEHLDHPLEVEGYGEIKVDVAYGGVYFALVDAKEVGFAITPAEARDMVDLGMRITAAAQEQIAVAHPELPALNSIGYTMYCGREATPGGNLKSGTVIHPGRMDRSPCGTGTAARLAQMHARGELEVGRRVTQLSTIDSRFDAEILGTTSVGNRPAVLPRISGRAWIYGLYQLGVDPSDPYPLGYTMSDTWGPGVAAE
jgi:proline racemase